MLVAIPFYEKDRHLAVKLLDWMSDIGTYENHDLLFVQDEKTEPIQCSAKFKSFKILVVKVKSGQWPVPHNIMFQETARYIETFLGVPWLWFEPDAVLIRESGLDDIENEWNRVKTLFMGDLVALPQVPIHMSGVGVYPPKLSQYAPNVFETKDVAWDVAAGEQIVPLMSHTNLIQHEYLHGGFESLDQVKKEIHPETVLFHSDKTGSLIPLLRQQRLGTCDIFIKTYPKDYDWLFYCLRSIRKFTSGFRKTVVISPDPLSDNNGLWNNWQQHSEFGLDGYLSQQVHKLYADTYTDADLICFIDSDTIFTQPVTPLSYFTGNKINWLMTPYSKTQTPWQLITEKFLNHPVEYEFMRRAPQMIPVWLITDIRLFCETVHGVSLKDYVMSQPYRAFSEFNALGAYAYEVHRDKFNFLNTEEVSPEDWPELTVDQRWSHGGMSLAIRAEWEKVLA